MFCSDSVANRTYDKDAGLELFFVGTSLDGITHFKLRDISGEEYFFSASNTDGHLKDPSLHDLDGREPFIWVVLDSNEKWSDRIYESLKSFKHWHGLTSDKHKYFVRFESNGIDIDA